MNFELATTVVSTVVGSQALVALVQGFLSRKKTSAEAAQILLDKTLDWASKLSSRIDKLEAELKLKDELIAELRERIVHLETGV